MRVLSAIAALAAVASAAPFTYVGNANSAKRAPSTSHKFTTLSGSHDKVIVTKENTLNGTSNAGGASSAKSASVNAAADGGASIPLRLVNNLAGDAVNCYISGTDPEGKVFFLGEDGTLHYPTAGGSAEPVAVSDPIAIAMPAQGETFEVTVPTYFESGRIYFVQGELEFFMVATDTGGDGVVQPSVNNVDDPSAPLNWGFVEMTLTEAGEVWANISFVDFVGLIVSMTVEQTDNTTQQVLGLPGDAVGTICDELKKQGDADGLPWASMCVTSEDGTPLRVVAPNIYESVTPGEFDDYWSPYVDDVYTKYSSEPLTITTQDGNSVDCTVTGDELNCDGDNRAYPKPTAMDIWGCNSGPFGIIEGDNDLHRALVPILCAAFVRSALLVDGGNQQPGPDTGYYTVDPTQHYSRIIHETEVDGKGYAFSYDDVNPTNSDDAAGLINSPNPSTLVFYIGGNPQ